MRRVRRLALVSLLGPILFLFACSDSSAPSDGAMRDRGPISLQNVWPDEDGRSWVYSKRVDPRPEIADVPIFASPEEVPAMPDLDFILSFLEGYPHLEHVDPTGSYGLIFDGNATTRSGAQGKNLAPFTEPMPAADQGLDPILEFVLHHRPELDSQPLDHQKTSLVPRPLVLRDGVWVRTKDYIAFYNHHDTEPRFRLLEDDMTPGHEWSVELFPTIDAGATLHARVLEQVPEKFPGLGGPSSLRVLYVLDFGILTQFDNQRNPLGYSRYLAITTVDYRKAEGPVHFHELNLIYVDRDPDGTGVLIGPGEETAAWLRD